MRRRRRVFTRTTPSVVRRTARHVHQERILWAPILIGITVGVAAVITGWVGPDRWILTTYALGVLLLLLGVWRGYRDDPAELVYGIVCVVTGAGWTVAVWTGVGQPWDLFWSLVVATLLLGFFWWNNDREHARVKIEKEQRAWPELVKGTGLARTVLGQKTRTAVGWTAVLWWRPGEFGVRRALDAAEDLEGLTNAPAGSITVETIGREANMVRVQCVEDDPHADPIGWDGAVLTRVSERVNLGLFPDGTPLVTQWWEPGVGGHHKLLAGMTRSGKSTLMRLLTCQYGPAEDVVQWMIDLKGGMALGRVSPLSDWFVTKPEPALAMLSAAVRIIDARAEESTRQRWDVWKASPAFPVLVIWVDELSRLTGVQAAPGVAAKATQLCTTIMQLGAGVGVLFCGATQYAVLDALGTSQLREQFAWTACFRMRSEGTAANFLPNAPRGIDPNRIPDDRKGTCYIDAMGKFRPDPARIRMISDQEVDEVVRAWWDRTPELDRVSRDAAGPDYAARDIPTPDGTAGRDMTDEPDNPTEDPVTPEPDNRTPQPDTGPTLAELAQAELERMTPEQRRAELAARTKALSERADGSPDTARGILMQLLAEAGPDGVFPRDVRAACRMSESWVFRALRELREQGRAELNPDGRTKLLGPDADRVQTGAGSSLR